MTDSSDDTNATLIEFMTVDPAGTPDSFTGNSMLYGSMGIYGGHLVAQALSAGFQTVSPERHAQSFHCHFLNAGNTEIPIHYHVERLREGRASDVRNIRAEQEGRTTFFMTATYKNPENGDDHQGVMPEVGDPDELRQAAIDADKVFEPPPTRNGRAEFVLASDHFIQEEYVKGREPLLRFWMRSLGLSSLTPQESQVVLAFLSDGPLMFNSIIPHGLAFQTHWATTIDHSGWFHRAGDVTDWMLFDQHSSTAADGRGMNHGTVYSRDRRLLMTVAQESILREMTGGK